MPLLTLDAVNLAFGHVPLLQDANLRVESGERVALIGRNGSGKSSLLEVVAGDRPADAGAVWRAPGLRVARLAQEVPRAASGTVRDHIASGLQSAGDDAWAVAHKVDIVLSRLALPAEQSLEELSGGWRRRVLLGTALVSEPDLLLLDEPTNHLDIEAIAWLEDYLQAFGGALIFVTHDRAFLRRLATRIVELDRGVLTSWPVGYDEYVRNKGEALETEAREIERLDKRLAGEEAWLRRGIKARRTRDEGRVRALTAMRAERAAYRAQPDAVRMGVERAEPSGRLVFEAERVTKAYGARPVISNFSTRIHRGDRIGLIGPNGSGKTTLLRLLVGEVAPDLGNVRRGARLEIAYFDQQREQLDPDRTVVESVADGETVLAGGQPRHVIGYLSDFLFPRERMHSPVKSLSGGERNRLLLARLFARPANVLILDEPTNDLDIETLELLEHLIAGFDGTVLLVTHDREFLDNVVTSTLAFEGNGRIREYVGGWHDYLRQSAGQGGLAGRSWSAADVEAPSAAPKPSTVHAAAAAAEPRRPRKRTFKEEREYAALPARIDELEAEHRRLHEETASPDFYKEPPERIRAVLSKIDEVGRELEAALERWVTLEEIGRG